jgi:hypothetical protein
MAVRLPAAQPAGDPPAAWPGSAGSWPPPGEARTCPVRCDHKASRPDAATTPGLPLNDLAPRFAPNGTGHRMAAIHERGQRAGQRGNRRDLPPDWNCPCICQARHISSDLGFCLRVELRTFSVDGPRQQKRAQPSATERTRAKGAPNGAPLRDYSYRSDVGRLAVASSATW